LGANQLVRVRYQANATESKLTGVSCFCLCYATAVKSISVDEYEEIQRQHAEEEGLGKGEVRKTEEKLIHHHKDDANNDDDEDENEHELATHGKAQTKKTE